MSYPQLGTSLADYLTALNRRRNAADGFMPPQRMRLQSLLSLHDSDLASVVNLPIIMPAPVDEPVSHKWTFRPSSRPRTSAEFEPTHYRAMPLPFEIDLMLCGKTYSCVYLGHGRSKVVYGIGGTSVVLKLTGRKDQEPDVFQQLSRECRDADPATKICPAIYVAGPCEEETLERVYKHEWYGWVEDHAMPLNKYIQGLNVDHMACIKLALYKQIVAAQHGLLLSDNNLFNLGVLDDTVVIIDTGSRSRQTRAISKGTMNDMAINKWWKKLESLPS